MTNLISYYKPCLLNLFEKLRYINKNPQKLGALREIQETLIEKITYTESKIALLRLRLKKLTKKLHIRRVSPGAKSESNKIKHEINSIKEKIDQYRKVRHIFRSIGDGLAFSYLSKWDIKPLCFKEDPGFIHRKKGSLIERTSLRQALDNGIPAILNDITTCLKYGDITVPTPEGKGVFVEIKSNPKRKRRTINQQASLESMATYLNTDRTTKLYGQIGDIQRRYCFEEEVVHIETLNSMLSKAYHGSNQCSELEPGQYIGILRQDNNCSFDGLKQIFDPLFRRLGRPYLINIYEGKFDNTGYYPLTLSIKNPQAIYDLYADKLMVILIIDLDHLKKSIQKYDLSINMNLGSRVLKGTQPFKSEWFQSTVNNTFELFFFFPAFLHAIFISSLIVNFVLRVFLVFVMDPRLSLYPNVLIG